MLSNIMITKRNGDIAPIDIMKIRKQTEDACDGLDNVDFSELELDAKLQFRDGISTEEIQQTLIKTAVDKIDIDKPNWTFVAARLFLNDMYHKVGKLFEGSKGCAYSHTLKDYIEYGVSQEIIHPNLLNESKYNFNELNDYIKPIRDRQFTYLGIKMLFDRYLQKDKSSNLFELPQHMFMAASMWLASNEENPTEWTKKFYDLISSFDVMVATPTLSNARLNRHQLSSCYQGSTFDSIEDIFDTFKDMSLLSKYGGGIGWDFTNIRATGSSIDNKPGASGGLIPWMKLVNDIAISVDQLGCVERNTYVEIIDSIEIDGKSYSINDVRDFDDNIKNIKTKQIKISECKIGDYIASMNINTKKKEYKKIEMLHEPIVKNENQIRITFDNGDGYTTSTWHPTLVFDENKSLIYKKAEECKVGDTTLTSTYEVATIIKIERNVNADENYFDLTVQGNNNYFCSTNGEYFHVVHNTRKGSIAVYVEPWHMDIMDFLDLKKNSGEERRRAHDLFPALWIPDLFMERVQNNDEWTLFDPNDTPDLHSLHGKEFTDRYEEYEHYATVRKQRINAKDLWKKILREYYETGNPFITFKDEHNRRNQNSHVGVINASNLCVAGDTLIDIKYEDNIKKIEIKNLEEYLEKYKDVYVKSKNTVTNNVEWKKITNFAMTSPKAKVLKITDSETGKSLVCTPDHQIWTNNRGYVEAKNIKSSDELSIDSINLNYHSIEIENLRDEIEVYDITVEDNHNFYANDILIHNCTEISQVTKPAEYGIKVTFESGKYIVYGNEENINVLVDGKTYTKKAKRLTSEDVLEDFPSMRIHFVERHKITDRSTLVCNLASINLSKINTKEDIERITPILVRMVDNVIDLNYYPVQNAQETNKQSRAIGIGMMGEAQMLAEKQIHYGSQEHLQLVDSLYEAISYNVIKASSNLAQEKGSYPKFKDSSWNKGILPIDTQCDNVKELVTTQLHYDWDQLREQAKQGMRNGYLMAIAPTSSISLLSGTTSTIEPVYKRKWLEENMSGLIPVIVPNLSPDTYMYYESAYDIDQIKVVKAAAVRQKWIDQAQSLNIHIKPEIASGKYLNEIYMTGWKYGIKSFYYLRSKSPEEEKVIDRSMECVGCQ